MAPYSANSCASRLNAQSEDSARTDDDDAEMATFLDGVDFSDYSDYVVGSTAAVPVSETGDSLHDSPQSLDSLMDFPDTMIDDHADGWQLFL